jgi:hypothetical protein
MVERSVCGGDSERRGKEVASAFVRCKTLTKSCFFAAERGLAVM